MHGSTGSRCRRNRMARRQSSRWAGALSYTNGPKTVLVPARGAPFNTPARYARWVFKGSLGSTKDSSDQSRLQLGIGVNDENEPSKVNGYAIADSLDKKFASLIACRS
jgi:hypothetical protein